MGSGKLQSMRDVRIRFAPIGKQKVGIQQRKVGGCVKEVHCVKCGDTGITWDMQPCTCRHNVTSIYDGVSCLDIPEQYRNILFNKSLVPMDMDKGYAEFLDSVHTSITLGKWGNHNLCIASPISHSKTIMAYSCINALFRAGIDIFPIYDVLELYRIITDMDLGKKGVYEISEPEKIVSVPILFAKIPRVSRWEVYDCISLLVDRRVRRGVSTIFLYDGTWQHLVNNDKNDIISGMAGNGSFGTIEVKSWNSIVKMTGIQLDENIG